MMILAGFALIGVMCTESGDCAASKAINENLYHTRQECMADRKKVNDKYIICGEVWRNA